MQPFPKTGSTSPGKIGDIVVDAIKVGKIDPEILKKSIKPTCTSSFSDHFAAIKKQNVSATLAILPNNNNINTDHQSLEDTLVTFKAKDENLATTLKEWNANLDILAHTVAYATFSNVAYLLNAPYYALLCIVSGSNPIHQLILRHINAGPQAHAWTSHIAMSYCKKDMLFLLASDDYMMSVDFGI